MLKHLVPLLVLLILVVVALVADNNMPMASFRLQMSEHVTIKISVYNSSEGFARVIIENIRAMLEELKKEKIK